MKLVSLAALAAAVLLLVWGFERGRKETAENERPIQAPARVSVSASGDVSLTLDAATQARIGLKAEALEAGPVRPEVVAYGTLQEDPARGFVVRAPAAGTLRRGESGGWPSLGQTIAPGHILGAVEPRLAVMDRVSLRERLATAEAEVEAASASLEASRAAYERARVLNSDQKNVSDRALQEAEARMKSDAARLRAANRSVALLKSSLEAGGMVPLAAQAGGQVVEIAAQPGEAIEAGQPILRLTRFDELLAAVNVPAGQASAAPAASRIVVAGHEERPLAGVRVGLGGAVDPRTQAPVVVYRVRAAGFELRPGMAVSAHLEQPGPAQRGVVVPREAVVRYGGAAWVYLQTASDKFMRRAVTLDQPVAAGWQVAKFGAGERVVTTGAELLLSEELKSQVQVGEASEAR